MGQQKATGDRSRDRINDRNRCPFEDKRRIECPEIGQQIRGRGELHADKAGFPHIGACHFRRDHGCDRDRRGEHADQTEVEQEQMRSHGDEAHLYQGRSDHRDQHYIDCRGRHPHTQDDADQRREQQHHEDAVGFAEMGQDYAQLEG